MACTNALSAFSCVEPARPGFRNSRVMVSTLGGGVVASDFSCAKTKLNQPNTRVSASRSPVTLLMDSGLLWSLEFWWTSGAGSQGAGETCGHVLRSVREAIAESSGSQAGEFGVSVAHDMSG